MGRVDNGHAVEFSRRLRSAMSKRGMSSKVLSQETGLAKTTVDYYVSGKRVPTSSSLARIRNVLGCSWEELLGE
jgi:transcriptional regulator with XRE-family HTH domain